MAVGANDRYWDERTLPSVLKHSLLDRYVPKFAGMTGQRTQGGGVVFLDGYAGRGRYDNGDPASAERILRIAAHQRETVGLEWQCFFVEKHRASAEMLHRVVAEYQARGVTARAHHGAVLDVLDDVIRSADGNPLFLFLDPTGLGLPFTRLTRLLQIERRSTWPPTEMLVNFSLDAVRRIGGHVSSPHADEQSMGRLDEALGGAWWRQFFQSGVSDTAVESVAAEFARRVERETGMTIVTVPVRRAPTHKPLYHLLFGTRRQHGLWAFGDAVARATETWWDTLDEVEAAKDTAALFTIAETIRPRLASTESAALIDVTANLILQRQLWSGRSVAAAAVVAGACLVLASSSPVRPVDRGGVAGDGGEGEGGE